MTPFPQSRGPVLVRHWHEARISPDSHSPRNWLYWLRTILLLIGIGLIGYYGYTIANQYVYQDYENWAFDQQISGRQPVTFGDYLRAKTPLGDLLGQYETRVAPVPADSVERAKETPPAYGSILGRVTIERLHLSAMVREGVDADTLSKAVGHVPTTALAGRAGNFAIAAHRDTLFRALKDIRKDDLVTFEAPSGSYTYRVNSTRIVRPTEVSVLRSDGGFPVSRIERVSAQPHATNNPGRKLITLITCYPFYYVGSAPRRFIVQGELVSESIPASSPVEAKNWSPPHRTVNVKHRRVRQSVRLEPRPDRGSSHSGTTYISEVRRIPPKKKGFWHRLLGSL